MKYWSMKCWPMKRWPMKHWSMDTSLTTEPWAGRIGFAGLCLGLALLGQGCGTQSTNSAEQSGGTVVLTGSSTVAPVVSEIGKQYEQENPSIRIDVQTGGSSRGIADARSGVADLGMVSRDLKPDESDLLSHAVARDGISVILHRDNPVTALNDQQIQDIYTKKITNWQAVGGPDQAITVVNKAQGRSTLELFEAYFEFEPKAIKADVIIGDNQQGLKTVAANPNAIGYVSIGAAEVDIQQGAPLKILPIAGVDATLKNVQNGSFPLSRTLNIVSKGDPDELAQAFISFAQSPQVHDVIEQQYLVPIQ